MLDMFLEVTPVPKGRPRFSRGVVYTPAKTHKAEKDIRSLLLCELRKTGVKITAKPVCVKMRFNYIYPRRLTKHDKLLADLDMLYKVSRPDIDNLVKLVCDAMNGLVYEDDNQVVKLFAEKVYSKREGIELKVLEL